MTRSAPETNKPRPTHASANAKIGIAIIANSVFSPNQLNNAFSIKNLAIKINL